MIGSRELRSFSRTAPFWASLGMVPIVVLSAIHGGWALLLPPLVTWLLFSVLDRVTGLDLSDADPDTAEKDIFWYRLVTLIWPPVQFLTVFGVLGYVTRADHHTGWEAVLVFFGVGILTGTIGIVYAHELLHQRNRFEQWLGDLLLATVFYGHFRSEHLLVHHRYVGTPRDAVTARYNEDFHSYFFRVLPECAASAFRAEREKLARKGLPWWDRSNPFWRYGALQAFFALLAVLIGGWYGLALYLFQALVAVWQLELVNYVEHYGLVRKPIGGGRYEPARPHHSWNAAHRASNWLLINLQRHADHHAKPDRRFPLLQNHGPDEAPQLPYGYPVMTIMALVPPLWRQVMNPRVRKWRAMFYPEVTRWSKDGTPA